MGLVQRPAPEVRVIARGPASPVVAYARGLDLALQGPGALWTAAEQYQWAIQRATANAPWQSMWSLCQTSCTTISLTAWRGAGCAFTGCNSQSGGFGNPLTVDVPSTINTVAIGENRVVFGSNRMVFGKHYTRLVPGTIPPPDPANPTVTVEVPLPVPDPFAPAAPWHMPQPSTNPAPNPRTQPWRNPRPEEQPSTAPAPRSVPTRLPSDMPGRVVTAPQTVPHWLAPPSTAFEFPPEGAPRPVPAPRPRPRPGQSAGRNPTDRPPRPREKQQKLNVRTAAGAAWAWANAAWEAAELAGMAFATLPAATRARYRRPTPSEQAQAVWDNWEDVDWATAFEEWANNAIEDGVIGLTVGRGGRAANQLGGNATGGGNAMSGHWGQDGAPNPFGDGEAIPEIDVNEETGAVTVRWGKRYWTL